MQKYCKFAVLLVNIKGNALGFDEYLSTSTERPDIRYLGVLGLSKISNIRNLYQTWQIIILWVKSIQKMQKF